MSKWIPNSFQLPNALVDDKYLIELKGSALAMYIFIVRKTRGWQKECDRISLSQFTEFTGYNKDAVLTGVNKLVDLGLVKRISYENKTSFYELNDQPLPPENLLSENTLAENKTSASGKSAKMLSENQTHNNKENNSKKTNSVYSEKFEKFWSEYPRSKRKGSKSDASKVFKKYEKDADLIISVLCKFKVDESFLKNNGEFVPSPSSWLNKKHWENEFWIGQNDSIELAVSENIPAPQYRGVKKNFLSGV